MLLLMVLLACEAENQFATFATNSENQENNNYTNDTTDNQDTGFLADTGQEERVDGCLYDDATKNEDPNDLVGRVECGADFWTESCSGCHGANGEGTASGQQLQGHIAGHTDADLIRSIVEGEGTMPAYDTEHPQMIADVVAFMRANF